MCKSASGVTGGDVSLSLVGDVVGPVGDSVRDAVGVPVGCCVVMFVDGAAGRSWRLRVAVLSEMMPWVCEIGGFSLWIVGTRSALVGRPAGVSREPGSASRGGSTALLMQHACAAGHTFL